MGVKERRERERDETRAKIANAARELFAREGYDAVSMRRIAEAIEYSPTAIYVHFKDKETLFQELCRQDFGKLAEVFAQLARVEDPVDRIRQIGSAYVRFALLYPNHYRLMFMTGRQQPVHADHSHRGDPDYDAYAFLRLAVQQAQEAGIFLPHLKDAELLAQVFWATAHGVASLQIAKGNDSWVDWRPVEQRAQVALDAILRGLLADPSRLDHRKITRKAGAR
jgi:AcrR family transcriptional regulator